MEDLTGRQFGYWTVLGLDHTENYFTYWLCKCKCGEERVVFKYRLTRGTSQSCGCKIRKGDWTDDEINILKEYLDNRTNNINYKYLSELLHRTPAAIEMKIDKLGLRHKYPRNTESLEDEIWKDVEGYEGYYQVSNLGRVKSVDRYLEQTMHGKTVKRLVHGNILSPHGVHNVTPDHLAVNLTKDHCAKMFYVHRLVALAFIPNPNNLPFINHKDENPENNNVNNLEWCTAAYNTNYGTCIDRRISKIIKTVNKIDKETNEVLETYSSAAEAGRKNNICSSSVTSCCRNVRKTAGGFKWEYADKSD